MNTPTNENLTWIIVIYTLVGGLTMLGLSDILDNYFTIGSVMYLFTVVTLLISVSLLRKGPANKTLANFFFTLSLIPTIPLGLFGIKFYKQIVSAYAPDTSPGNIEEQTLKPKDELNQEYCPVQSSDTLIKISASNTWKYSAIGFLSFSVILLLFVGAGLFDLSHLLPAAFVALHLSYRTIFVIRDGELYFSNLLSESPINSSTIHDVDIKDDNVTFKLTNKLGRMNLKWAGVSQEDREMLIPYFQKIAEARPCPGHNLTAST